MKFRGAKNTDDWDFGRGKQCYLMDDDAIARNISTTLQTFQTECFYDSEFGLAWFTLLGQKAPDALLLALRQEIGRCYGVIEVKQLTAEMAEDRKIVIRYVVSTIFTTGLSGGLTL